VFDALFALIGKADAKPVLASGNSAVGQDDRRAGSPAGSGEGGGLSSNTAAAVSLDALTLADVINNTAFTSDNDIFGPFAIIP
jgi:hypothetical protein